MLRTICYQLYNLKNAKNTQKHALAVQSMHEYKSHLQDNLIFRDNQAIENTLQNEGYL